MDTPRRGALEWKALVDEYERSDLTIKEFCRLREINYWTFREWRRKRVDDKAETQLVEIGCADALPAGSRLFRVKTGSVTVEVAAPVDEANLAAVLRAVRRSQC